MAINNKDGFDFVNTLLRKERNGSPITTDRFNNLLNICFEEKVSDEYFKFEGNQKNTDFFRFLKRTALITPDDEGVYSLTDLSDSYWHHTGLTYESDQGREFIDMVTDDEWDRRISSTLEEPSLYFPICKVSDDKLYFTPLAVGILNPNLVSNSGFGVDTDWVNPTSGVAENWDTSLYLCTGQQATGQFGFDGTAQGFRMDDGSGFGGLAYSPVLLPNLPAGRYSVTFEYAISNQPGDTAISVVVNAANFIATLPAVQSVSTKDKFTVSFDFSGNAAAPGFSIVAQNDTVEPTKTVYLDKVYLGLALDITLNYLKKPTTPYLDWYSDAQDRIQYLSEGIEYTLQTDETYIDKDDGTVRTSGYTITASVNKTVEMEIPDDDKRGVFYSMLAKLGVSLDQADATGYSMEMESKEASK
jgi:hypothetical protein